MFLDSKNLIPFLLIFSLFFGIFYCGDDEVTQYYTSEEKEDAPTNAESMELLNEYCSSCHVGENASGGIGYIDNLAKLLENDLIKSKDADASLLYIVLRDGIMPPSGPKPSKDEIAKIKTWIDNGIEIKDDDPTPTPTATVTSTTTATTTPTATSTPLPGLALFNTNCSSCHTASAKSGRTATQITNAIASQGAMMGISLNATQKQQIADYLATQ